MYHSSCPSQQGSHQHMQGLRCARSWCSHSSPLQRWPGTLQLTASHPAPRLSRRCNPAQQRPLSRLHLHPLTVSAVVPRGYVLPVHSEASTRQIEQRSLTSLSAPVVCLPYRCMSTQESRSGGKLNPPQIPMTSKNAQSALSAGCWLIRGIARLNPIMSLPAFSFASGSTLCHG